MELSESQRSRMIRNFFLASIPSFLLALVYVAIGMSLQGHPDYMGIDVYIFTAVGSVSMVLGSVMYYIHHSDLSETLAFAGNIGFWLFLGAEDVFVYLICMPIGKCGYPEHLAWLNDSVYGYIGTQILGLENVIFSYLVVWVIWAGSLVLIWNLGMYYLDFD